MADGKWAWRYRDLFLTIERSPEGDYKVTGEFDGKFADAKLQSPISPEEIARLWEAKSDVYFIQEIGHRLYSAIFSRAVLSLLTLAENSLHPWEGLRLRIQVGPEISEWPFETLHDKRAFLALRKDRLIVRGHPKPMGTLWAPRPLRVLVVVSNPRSQSLDTLDVEKEWKEIQDALFPLVQKKKVKVERLDTPTLSDLAAELGKKKFHVLHFIGHGKFNAGEAGGVIYLKASDGNATAVPGPVLAELLCNFSSIRLVVLNTCEGALGYGDRFSGVAQALILKEIPAVLAMQAKIPDPAAILFSRSFYERLAKGRPIDRALRKVRYELFLAGTGKEADWAMPVLFLGAKNGELFRLPFWRWILALLLTLSLVAILLTIKPWKSHCPEPKAVDMDFVWIEPAPGSKISKPYCLGVHEVSRGEWEAVMGANSLPKEQRGDDDLPVGASYIRVKEFIRKLNEQEGKPSYRLPTEVEWEYAAIGPGRSRGGNCKDTDDYDGPAPVGSFRTNDWGLYDMVGNVWEWVEAPDATADRSVRRGAAWDSAKQSCRLTNRKSVEADRNLTNTGFRLARDVHK